MKVAVGSAFRNAAGHIDRYAAQVTALVATQAHDFRFILAEGDSTDDSYALLKAKFNGAVFKRVHGGAAFGSVCDPVRHRQMSWVKQGIFDRVTEDDEVFISIEGDLIWGVEVILQLVRHLERPQVDVVAPFCWIDNRNYDDWGFRGLDGERVGFYPPHHRCLLDPSPTGLYELSSVGSCLAMRGEVARTASFSDPDNELVGFCADVRAKGFRIWLDPALKVFHP